MLQLGSEQFKLCNATTRRGFLQAGALAMGGLSLTQLLQLESQAGIRGSNKAIIMIYLVGAVITLIVVVALSGPRVDMNISLNFLLFVPFLYL